MSKYEYLYLNGNFIKEDLSYLKLNSKKEIDQIGVGLSVTTPHMLTATLELNTVFNQDVEDLNKFNDWFSSKGGSNWLKSQLYNDDYDTLHFAFLGNIYWSVEGEKMICNAISHSFDENYKYITHKFYLEGDYTSEDYLVNEKGYMSNCIVICKNVESISLETDITICKVLAILTPQDDVLMNKFLKKLQEPELEKALIKSIPCTRDSKWNSGDTQFSKEQGCKEPYINVLLNIFEKESASPDKNLDYCQLYAYPDINEIGNNVKIDDTTFSNLGGRNFGSNRFFCINQCWEYQDDIVMHFCKRSQETAVSKKNCVEYILGNRGVGKTTYINYLLSTKMSKFNKENVATVRVNLADSKTIGHSILELVLLKCKKQILNTYLVDELSESVEYSRTQYTFSQFMNYIREYEGTEFKKLIEYIELNCESVYELRRIRNPKHQINLGDLLIQFMKHNNQSFIFFLDGFDESTVPLMKTDKLESWKDALSDIYCSCETYPTGLYIVISRENSLQDIVSFNNNEGLIGKNSIQWVVRPSKLEDVLRKKVNHMYIYSQKKKQLSHWKEEYFITWFNITQGMVKLCFDKLNINNDFLDMLSQNGHMRDIISFYSSAMWETAAIMQESYQGKSMQFIFADLLKSFKKDGYEFITRRMVKTMHGKVYRILRLSSLVAPYIDDGFISTIDVNGVRKLYSNLGENQFPLIPNVWGNASVDSRNGCYDNYLLIKIRILQILNCYAEMNKEIQFVEVMDLLSGMFRYNRDNAGILIKMCYQDRLIDYDYDDTGIKSLENSNLVITKIGQVVLNELLTNMDYYEITIQQSYIPINIKGMFQQTYITRVMGPFKNNGDNLTTYFDKYHDNLSNFIDLLHNMNEWEKNIFEFFAQEQILEKRHIITYFQKKGFDFPINIRKEHKKHLMSIEKYYRSRARDEDNIKFKKMADKANNILKFKYDF